MHPRWYVSASLFVMVSAADKSWGEDFEGGLDDVGAVIGTSALLPGDKHSKSARLTLAKPFGAVGDAAEWIESLEKGGDTAVKGSLVYGSTLLITGLTVGAAGGAIAPAVAGGLVLNYGAKPAVDFLYELNVSGPRRYENWLKEMDANDRAQSTAALERDKLRLKQESDYAAVRGLPTGYDCRYEVQTPSFGASYGKTGCQDQGPVKKRGIRLSMTSSADGQMVALAPTESPCFDTEGGVRASMASMMPEMTTGCRDLGRTEDAQSITSRFQCQGYYNSMPFSNTLQAQAIMDDSGGFRVNQYASMEPGGPLILHNREIYEACDLEAPDCRDEGQAEWRAQHGTGAVNQECLALSTNEGTSQQ